MKKLIALVLILTLALALVACKNDKTDNGTENGGGNNVGNTIDGGNGGNSTCVGLNHTDGNNDWVCDDCGSDLTKSGYVDENGTIQLPPTDI